MTIGFPARSRASAVWVDSRMVVWGGIPTAGLSSGTGAVYFPPTDSWAPVSTIGAPAPRGGAAADALSALANLGFKPAEASAAVAAANEELGPDASLDALVRLALKKAAK